MDAGNIENKVSKFFKDIEELVASSYSRPLLMIFTSTWIASSSIIEIVTDKIDNQLTDTNILTIDIDEYRPVAVKYKINTLPTCIVIYRQEMVFRKEGIFSKKEIVDQIYRLKGLPGSLPGSK